MQITLSRFQVPVLQENPKADQPPNGGNDRTRSISVPTRATQRRGGRAQVQREENKRKSHAPESRPQACPGFDGDRRQ